jgi:hypothetical protein
MAFVTDPQGYMVAAMIATSLVIFFAYGAIYASVCSLVGGATALVRFVIRTAGWVVVLLIALRAAIAVAESWGSMTETYLYLWERRDIYRAAFDAAVVKYLWPLWLGTVEWLSKATGAAFWTAAAAAAGVATE